MSGSCINSSKLRSKVKLWIVVPMNDIVPIVLYGVNYFFYHTKIFLNIHTNVISQTIPMMGFYIVVLWCFILLWSTWSLAIMMQLYFSLSDVIWKINQFCASTRPSQHTIDKEQETISKCCVNTAIISRWK